MASSGCPCSGATLDRLVQPAILAALTEGPIHGYRLAERVTEMTGMFADTCDMSGIYRVLKKMEAMGLVASAWETADTGHAKRLYQITADGRTCLGRWVSTLEAYKQAIATLMKAAKTAAARKPQRRRRKSAK
jgi:PadR family transcriptional regulator, regulatory protein PadR